MSYDLRFNHPIVHIFTYGFYYLLIYRVGDVMSFDEWKIKEEQMPAICEYMQDLSFYIGAIK